MATHFDSFETQCVWNPTNDKRHRLAFCLHYKILINFLLSPNQGLPVDIIYPLFDALKEMISVVLHIDQHLNGWVGSMGPWIYVLLFLIIFCETGLVVTPFLPGDSLLFALGAIAAIPESPLSAILLFFILTIAAIIGDTVNYSIGKFAGPKVFKSQKIPLLNQKQLLKTQEFYLKHGGKTIVWARFIPIIRTFAPFVAGIGSMNYQRFLSYNILGAIFWISSFLSLGYLFGNLPIIQKNFHIVIFVIIFISFLPVVIEYLKSLKAKRL